VSSTGGSGVNKLITRVFMISW